MSPEGKDTAAMRGLKPRKRAKVKKIRGQKGIRAAIDYARRVVERSGPNDRGGDQSEEEDLGRSPGPMANVAK